jgi:hypothetical protein
MLRTQAWLFRPFGFLVFASLRIPNQARIMRSTIESLWSIPSEHAAYISQPSVTLIVRGGRGGWGGVGRSRS